MVRWTGIALLAVLVSACAARPDMRPVSDLSNRELLETLAREGVGTIVTEESARLPPDRGERLGAEIRETPRGVVVTFRHVLFGFDSAQLGPMARREVERFAVVLNDARVQRRTVILEGHADAIGTAAYNMELSRRRATVVADELIAHGVGPRRLAVEAYGEQRPVAPDTNADGTDNPAGRARNRRVEAVIQN